MGINGEQTTRLSTRRCRVSKIGHGLSFSNLMFMPTGWKPSERFRHLYIYIYVPWGRVGWGGAITFTYLRTPMMLRHGTFTCTCAHTSCQRSRSVDILPRKRTKIEWPHLDVRSHMAVALGGKCTWKSPVGENRCVLSEDVEITGKNGCRWGFGDADFPKEPFSHSDMSTI